MPPQETGLVYNSWFGKPHLEMTWWHGVHFGQWGDPKITTQWLDWHKKYQHTAENIAKRQGYMGIRWQKMTDHLGNETASSVGSYLIWQQPHPIYFAEQQYKLAKTAAEKIEILKKYGLLVQKTAEFMADFLVFDPKTQQYNLPAPLIPAQECFVPDSTFNPTFELAYWRWGIETAQRWLQLQNKPTPTQWQQKLDLLAQLPEQNSVYLATAATADSYTNAARMIDHPAVLMAYGFLPATKGLKTNIMQNTFDTIWQRWTWPHTWGWDFPMVAMAAARLNQPERALDALLMPIQTNTYLANGHNYQDKRLRLYLPGNGGLLIALGMMAAGWEGSMGPNPGFPKNWNIRWEGINKFE
jgi:protein-glucosylgalactosylhydroxylysine glucosidase